MVTLGAAGAVAALSLFLKQIKEMQELSIKLKQGIQLSSTEMGKVNQAMTTTIREMMAQANLPAATRVKAIKDAGLGTASSYSKIANRTVAQTMGIPLAALAPTPPSSPFFLSPMPTAPLPYRDDQNRMNQATKLLMQDVDWGDDKPPPKKDLDAAGGLFDGLGKLAGKAFLFMSIGGFLVNLLNAMFPFGEILSVLTESFTIYGAVISESFAPIMQAMFEALLAPEVLAMVAQLGILFGELFTAMMPLGAALLPIGMVLMQSLMPALTAFIPLISALAPIFVQLSPTISMLVMLLGLALKNAFELLLPIVKILVPVVMWLAQAIGILAAGGILILGGLFEGITIAIQWLADKIGQISLGEIFKNLLNAGIAVLNLPMTTINALLDKLDPLNTVGRLSSIPYLAEGGIVTRPTLAMIGEAGPEAVVPLDRANNTNIGGSTVINVYGDVTEEHLFKMQREVWLRSLS